MDDNETIISQKNESDIWVRKEEGVVRLYGSDEFGVPIERANIPLLIKTLEEIINEKES